MTDSMAKAAGLMVVTDGRLISRAPLPEVLTPEWLEKRFREFSVTLQSEIAAVVDTVIQRRLPQVPAPSPHPSSGQSDLLTTSGAAEYLQRSASWLLKRNDIPYVRGLPNHYRKRDLDNWLSQHRHRPTAG